MPGMAPASTPAAKKTEPTANPMPASPFADQGKTKSMSEMSPPQPDANKAPNTEGTKSGMRGMRGMDATVGSKAKPMPAMDQAGSPVRARMSIPGVTILGPPQKWEPPSGDDRTSELVSRPALATFQHFLQSSTMPVEDSQFHSLFIFDLLEYRANSKGSNTFVWDAVGWLGGDYNRLWVKTEGREDLSRGNRGEGDLQLLYGRLIAPFWDFQIGVRAKENLDSDFKDPRTYAVIGVQGIAPGNFNVEPAIYISDAGEVSGELTVSDDIYLTQRLVLQPRFQGEFSLQGDKRFDTGEGVTETDIGLRLRYEIRREIAPYIGVSWLRKYGETSNILRLQRETTESVSFVAGVQVWW
jgi:copper resistance protein B